MVPASARRGAGLGADAAEEHRSCSRQSGGSAGASRRPHACSSVWSNAGTCPRATRLTSTSTRLTTHGTSGLCVVPDGDLFKAIGTGKASVVTDRITTFTESGILLESGRRLEADIIVTATGLNLQLLGGMQLSVDGRPVKPAETVVYRGMMLSGIPNFAMAIGYTNSSWTLKIGLVCEYFCRLLRHMDDNGYDAA